MSQIQLRAKLRARGSIRPIEQWFEGKYRQPATSKTFRRKSIWHWIQKFYEDLWAEKAALDRQVQNGTIEPEQRSRLRYVDNILNNVDPDDLLAPTGDKLIDQWLTDLREGRTPDLTIGLDPSLLEALNDKKDPNRS